MLDWVALTLASAPAGLACWNIGLLRRPARADDIPGLSVLIPARNEEANIADAVNAALASQGVDLEVVVLDDGSTDRTIEILAGISDPRVRVATGVSLPAGWTGKQHACMQLLALAKHELMVFVDADVRLATDAASRMAGFMQRNDVGLARGFPRQTLCTWSEQLLLPFIHVMLVGFLPIKQMCHSRIPALGAACGQLVIVRRSAYLQAGCHAASRASLHDGLSLPRTFRRAGFATDLFDATDFATVRMYSTAAQVWDGLSKNATEGMARPGALVVWTILLGGGQVLPAVLAILAPSPVALIALAISIVFSLAVAVRFRQPSASAFLNAVGASALLAVQWVALWRSIRGKPALWRGREYRAS